MGAERRSLPEHVYQQLHHPDIRQHLDEGHLDTGLTHALAIYSDLSLDS